jgi:hypothetical protein
MRQLTLLLLLIFGSWTAVRGQYPYERPTPDPALMRQLEWQRVRRQLDRLDNLSKTNVVTAKNGEDNPRIILESLYRRSTDGERHLLSAEKDDLSKYEKLLTQPNTGMTKLVRDFGCDEYSSIPPNKQICLEFSMPGGGSAFSFRQADYQFWKLSDLLYDGRSFIAFGQMSLGFIVDLGDVPLDTVRSDSLDLSYLTNFEPHTDIASVTKQNNDLVDGIRSDGRLYKKFLPVVVNDTYVMRSIAYKGKVPMKHFEISYNELDFDKRKDVIVTFRVVRSDINGTVTLAWKILQRKVAPELKLAK